MRSLGGSSAHSNVIDAALGHAVLHFNMEWFIGHSLSILILPTIFKTFKHISKYIKDDFYWDIIKYML